MGNVRAETCLDHARDRSDLRACLQGAKAQQKRERNAAKQGATAKSQIKVNEAAKNIICQTCRQTFVSPLAFL